MNVGYKHTPYNYKCNCSWTVLHYQKVHFFFKSTAQQNFLAMGLLALEELDEIQELVPNTTLNFPYFLGGAHKLSS